MRTQIFMPIRCLLAVLCLPATAHAGSANAAASDPLRFDPAAFTTLRVTLDGAPVEVRRYRVVYVSKPIRMAAAAPAGMAPGATAPPDPLGYQSMNIYVPQRAYQDQRTAIILQVNNGGWIGSVAAERIVEGGAYRSDSDSDPVGAALKAGYVIVNAGTRSRNIRSEQGDWAGKSPAVVVDAKAAVRYLRHNDAVMPGSAERIVITGTSGGGGLSVAVAASGNSADFLPYLAQIGAAGIDARGRSRLRDDVFATIAYCPITDLGHSDIAYEWQYTGIRSDANIQGGTYTPAMRQASTALAAAYPRYLNDLGLRLEDGSRLTADNLPDAIVALVRKGTAAGIARGANVPAPGGEFVIDSRGREVRARNDWLWVEDGQVKRIDYGAWLRFVAAITPLKRVPAFDPTANSGNSGVAGESSLFGPAGVEYRNFAEYSWNHNEVAGDGSGSDDTGLAWNDYVRGAGRSLAEQVRMTSPMEYLDTAATAAPYWYVRHGLLDRDTAFAVEVALYHAMRKDRSIRDANFELSWLQGHAGNYDVREAYAWLAGVLARTPQ